MAMTEEAERHVSRGGPAQRNMRRAATRTRQVQQAERRRQVVALALGGASWEAIGNQLEPKVSGERARQLFYSALDKTIKAADTDQARVLANARLERVLARWWPDMIQTVDDEKADRATGHVLKVLAELNRVNGAYRPVEVDVTGEVTHEVRVVSTNDVIVKLSGLRAQQVLATGPFADRSVIDVEPRALPTANGAGAGSEP